MKGQEGSLEDIVRVLLVQSLPLWHRVDKGSVGANKIRPSVRVSPPARGQPSFFRTD